MSKIIPFEKTKEYQDLLTWSDSKNIIKMKINYYKKQNGHYLNFSSVKRLIKLYLSQYSLSCSSHETKLYIYNLFETLFAKIFLQSLAVSKLNKHKSITVNDMASILMVYHNTTQVNELLSKEHKNTDFSTLQLRRLAYSVDVIMICKKALIIAEISIKSQIKTLIEKASRITTNAKRKKLIVDDIAHVTSFYI